MFRKSNFEYAGRYYYDLPRGSLFRGVGECSKSMRH